MVKDWIEAFRLRTLPLALSSIFMGGFLAHTHGVFSWPIFGLSVLTTAFLQILSNLANDYGDSVHGADGAERKGPERAVQRGTISAVSMKKAIVIFSTLSLVSGITLLYISFPSQFGFALGFFALGILAIYAAITYTSGSNPYGYIGLGDISVFVFFGLVGVLGSFFLYAQTFELSILLPAISCGLLSTAVLNVNNIRDIASDQKAGKKSIPVRIGRAKAVVYHMALLLFSFICATGYVLVNYLSEFQFLFFISLPLFLINLRAVQVKKEAMDLDPYLKQLALSTLIFVLLFGLGLFL